MGDAAFIIWVNTVRALYGTLLGPAICPETEAGWGKMQAQHLAEIRQKQTARPKEAGKTGPDNKISGQIQLGEDHVVAAATVETNWRAHRRLDWRGIADL